MIRYMGVFLKLNLPDNTSPDQVHKFKEQLGLYTSKLASFAEFSFDYQFDDTARSDEDYFDSKLTVLGTKSFYLSRWSQLGLDRLIRLFASLGTELTSGNCADFLVKEAASGQAVLKGWKAELKGAIDRLVAGFEEVLGGEGLEKVARIIECFSASLECVSFAVILLAMCLSNECLKPIWAEKMKKSKKKKGENLIISTYFFSLI